MNNLQITLLTWLGCLALSNAQNWYYYALGTGDTCAGTGSIDADGLEVTVTFDAHNIYNADGWTESKYGKYYRFTLCGQLDNSTCAGDWCFEEVNNTDRDSCLEALARWEENDNTTITYSVIYNETSQNTPDSPVGLHVQIANHYEIRKTCPNKESFINYNIVCQNKNETQYMSLWSNETRCEWNVTLRSNYGCVSVTSDIVIDSGSSSHKLSTGSVFVIIFVVVLLTYLILGCAYNSFYHGRVGVDAVPNKSGWGQLWRYFKAGCETTYDTLCCHQGNVDYQNL